MPLQHHQNGVGTDGINKNNARFLCGGQDFDDGKIYAFENKVSSTNSKYVINCKSIFCNSIRG